jgi:tetratricopeptide (TPR) repeat protein
MKKLCTSILLVLLLVLPCRTQTSGKNDELKFDADYFLMRNEFDKALKIYLNVLDAEPENADIMYRIGVCYLNSEDEKGKAIHYLSDAVKNVSVKYNTNSFKEFHAPIEAYFLLGSAYRINNQLDEAIEAYEKYKEYLDPKDKYNRQAADQYIQNCQYARELLKNPQDVTFTNLGNVINNSLANFNPVISGNGNIMAYTSPGKQGYDIYLSAYTDSAWSVPKNITPALGSGKYMKTSSLSYDGNTLLLSLEDPENSDLYVSQFKKGRWSKVVPLNKQINSKWNETNGSFSADGKTLYFTSNRKGGEGDLDIYRSFLKGDAWSEPENMGSEVNTPYNEETPFVSADDKELYFSSEGHKGMGGYDVFRFDLTKPGNDVKNMGYPINTTENNLFYVPFGDGTTAYYAFRGPDSYGGRDIYRVIVKETEVEPEAMAVVEPEPGTVVEEVEPIATIEKEAGPLTEVAVAEQVAVAAQAAVAEQVAAPDLSGNPGPPKESDQTETVSVPQVIPDQTEIVAVPQEISDQTEAEAPIQETAPEREEAGKAKSYTIQFMALRKPVDLQYFRGFSDISVTLGEDDWYRYTWMTTTDSLQADRIKRDLITKGFHDAFIRRKSVIPRYTVQVMAVPGPVTDLNIFSNLPEISACKYSDKFCRYTTGWYESRDDARNALAQIRSLGYPKAFVRKVKTLQ